MTVLREVRSKGGQTPNKLRINKDEADWDLRIVWRYTAADGVRSDEHTRCRWTHEQLALLWSPVLANPACHMAGSLPRYARGAARQDVAYHTQLPQAASTGGR